MSEVETTPTAGPPDGLHDGAPRAWRARLQRIASSTMFRNAAFSGLDHLLLPALWLIATPIFVARLGVDRFGIWMLVNSLLGLNGLFAFGLSDATIKYVSHYRALGDDAGVVRVIRSTLTIYLILATAAAVVAGLAAPWLAQGVFKVDVQDTGLLVIALRIAGLGMVVRMFDSVLQSALQGFERYDLAACVSMTANVLTVGLNAALAIAGYGLDVLLIVTLAVLAASGLVRVFLIKTTFLRGLAIRPSWDMVTMREIFHFGLYTWLHGVSGLLLGQADRLMIASMLGTRQLAYYAVSLQLAQQIHALPSKAGSFLFPLASAAHAVGDAARLRTIYFKAMFLVTATGISLGIPLFMMARGILTIWMGAEFADVATPVLQILAFNFSILSTTIVPYYYLMGTGNVRLGTTLGIASGVFVAAAAAVLIPRLGLTGAAWARLAVLPVHVLAWTVIHYWVLDDRRWYVSANILGPVLAAYGCCLALPASFFSTAVPTGLLIVLSVAWFATAAFAGGCLSFALILVPNRRALGRIPPSLP